MKKYVLDTFSIIAYFENEHGAALVSEILKQALVKDIEIFLSVINWGEMYHIALREGGMQRAELYRKTIAQYPIYIVEANKELTLKAAEYKAFHKMSYADAFAAALTYQNNAILVTGDKEFASLKKEIKISWI